MNYDPLDETGLRNRVKQTLRVDDAGADRVIAVYKKDRPKASNLDLFLIIASDGSNFRTGTDQQAERKTAQGAAPVYRYYFQWYSPVRDGKLRSMHTMELGFVVRSCRHIQIDDRRRQRTSAARRQDERRMGSFRQKRKSQS